MKSGPGRSPASPSGETEALRIVVHFKVNHFQELQERAEHGARESTLRPRPVAFATSVLAEQEGRMSDVAPEQIAAQSLTDAAIEALVAERTAAKKARNFARADQIRSELAEKGVILEDSKDGVRWKRK